jgi:hypothetical protein
MSLISKAFMPDSLLARDNAHALGKDVVLTAKEGTCDYQKLGQPVTNEVMHLRECHVLDQSSRGKNTLPGS